MSDKTFKIEFGPPINTPVPFDWLIDKSEHWYCEEMLEDEDIIKYQELQKTDPEEAQFFLEYTIDTYPKNK